MNTVITQEKTTHERRFEDRRKSDQGTEVISRCIQSSLNTYFKDMDGHTPGNLYEIVLAEIEKPLLEVVLKQSENNITKASEILGLNRGTLRKKLHKYGLSK